MSKLPAQHYRRRPPTRRRMRKHAFQMVVSVLAMFLLCIFFLAWTFPRDLLSPSAGSVTAIPEPPPSPAAASPAAEPEPQPVVQTVRFSATGDNLIHSPIYKQAKRRAAGRAGAIHLPVLFHSGRLRTGALSGWCTGVQPFQQSHLR